VGILGGRRRRCSKLAAPSTPLVGPFGTHNKRVCYEHLLLLWVPDLPGQESHGGSEGMGLIQMPRYSPILVGTDVNGYRPIQMSGSGGFMVVVASQR
jgi:hypothetical protein